MQATQKAERAKKRLKKIVKTSSKNPMTLQVAENLHNNGISIKQIQRIARRHYRTASMGSLLYVNSTFKVVGEYFPFRSVKIDFSEWESTNYVYVKPTHQLFTLEFQVDGARDLFRKLVEHKLI